MWIILASASFTVMAGGVIAPVLNLMGEGLGVNPSAARLIITTHGLFIAVCSPFAGILIDRVGVKKPFIFGLVIYGLSGAAGLLITNYWLLIISRMVMGGGIAAIYTAITVMILNMYKGQQRNHIMGWRASSNNFGGVIWPLLGGFLGTFSWHMPFAAYLLGIPLGVLAFIAIPEMHGGAIQSSNTTDNKESLLSLFKNTPVLFITYGLTFLAMFFLFANVIFLPKLVERFGMANPLYIGILLSVLGIAAAIASFLYGRIRAVLSYKAIVVIAMPFWAAGFAIIPQASSIWVVGLAMMLFGFGLGVIMPAAAVWAGESVPASFRGRITSYLATSGFIGQFLSPVILSPIASSLGLNAVFIVIAGISALLFVVFLTFLRRRNRN
ncbi:MFS transporter [Chloroflexota bacterium]